MTRDDADKLLSLLSLELGQPLPPDPHLKALVRMRFAHDITKQFGSELVALEADLVRVTDRMAELREAMCAWADLAESYAHDAAVSAEESPWPELLFHGGKTASEPIGLVNGDEGPPSKVG